MLKKLDYFLWISTLLVYGFLVGAYFSLGTNGFTAYDYEMKFVTGGIAMQIVLGGIAYLIFRYLKKSGHQKPLRPALLTATILLLFFTGITAFYYNDVKAERARQILMESQ